MIVLVPVVMLLLAGWVLGLPKRLVWGGVAVLWGAGILAHLILAEDHPLRQAIGGDWRAWALPVLIAALVMAYRAGLAQLRARVRPAAISPQGTFSATELDRYARHIVLREVGGTGQKKLKAAKVLVVGAGGLGSPALLYLAAAGVGTIGVIDDDIVSNSNLQRQIIHTDARIGEAKVASAAAAMKALNPFVTVRTYNRRLGAEEAAALFADYDLILDGSDNFDTRYLVNAACVAAGKPLISAAITQWEGQVGLYDPARGGPCYQCVFPERPAPGLAPSCAEAGVIAPLPGVVGSLMALEAVKLNTGAGAVLRGELLIWDGLWGESRKLSVKRRADCPVCGGHRAGG
ncbi:molybdopterin-synthase adenylyltransferase MoeB [Frigidibacter sp. SD6-1]|uniref:HesA/MoeB/ThiF family protein n=1 Tax=Frigidibacter sp. SD6-1 TaxID=3032581 RepID=UPI0024DF806F|nr:molybdopterin-synthase adenylyltransferase MoeB [Frigidibacter sp. SD6-1]